MKKFTVPFVILLLALPAIMTAADTTNKGPVEITLNAKMGNIHFAHAKHQTKIESCFECHHKKTKAFKCKSCHGVKKGVPSAKKIFHKLCRGCHRESGGPTKCMECHMG